MTSSEPLDGKFRDQRHAAGEERPGRFPAARAVPSACSAQMPQTPLAMEAQITKEYLGFATHLAYLGTMWEEVLKPDTCSPAMRHAGRRTIGAMAGVSNIGTDRNWTGSHFDQANWYAFGRLAWNHAAVRARRSPRNGRG